MSTKLPPESKKYYERELRQYWKNKIKLSSLLIKEQKSLKTASVSSRTVLYLQEHIENIETVIHKLKPFERDVFELIFKDNLDWKYCKVEKNIDKSTYYNIFNKCIVMLAEEYGEI